MRNVIREHLLELVGDNIETALKEIPFRSVEEIKDALQYLAEEVESIDPNDIFMELKMEDIEE